MIKLGDYVRFRGHKAVWEVVGVRRVDGKRLVTIVNAYGFRTEYPTNQLTLAYK